MKSVYSLFIGALLLLNACSSTSREPSTSAERRAPPPLPPVSTTAEARPQEAAPVSKVGFDVLLMQQEAYAAFDPNQDRFGDIQEPIKTNTARAVIKAICEGNPSWVSIDLPEDPIDRAALAFDKDLTHMLRVCVVLYNQNCIRVYLTGESDIRATLRKISASPSGNEVTGWSNDPKVQSNGVPRIGESDYDSRASFEDQVVKAVRDAIGKNAARYIESSPPFTREQILKFAPHKKPEAERQADAAKVRECLKNSLAVIEMQGGGAISIQFGSDVSTVTTASVSHYSSSLVDRSGKTIKTVDFEVESVQVDGLLLTIKASKGHANGTVTRHLIRGVVDVARKDLAGTLTMTVATASLQKPSVQRLKIRCPLTALQESDLKRIEEERRQAEDEPIASKTEKAQEYLRDAFLQLKVEGYTLTVSPSVYQVNDAKNAAMQFHNLKFGIEGWTVRVTAEPTEMWNAGLGRIAGNHELVVTIDPTTGQFEGKLKCTIKGREAAPQAPPRHGKGRTDSGGGGGGEAVPDKTQEHDVSGTLSWSRR